jgi:hypothetical protein
MYTVGSVLVMAATVPLAAGIAGDIYVVITMIAGAEVGLASAAAAVLLFLGLWYAFPLAMRLWRRGEAPRRYDPTAAG